MDFLDILREKAQRIEREIARLEAPSTSQAAMREHFPLGTGNPGNATGRRTDRARSRRIDASVKRAGRVVELRRELALVQRQIEYYTTLPEKLRRVEATLANPVTLHGAPLDREIVTELKRSAKRYRKDMDCLGEAA
jgi:hypothetical protein